MEQQHPSRVNVKILGEDYTILGDADESTILSIAELVDERMKELKKSLPNAGNTRIAVLCAMNLADELHQLRNNPSDDSQYPILEEKTKKIISLLEEGIIGDVYP